MPLPAESLLPSGRKVLSVGELARRVKSLLEDGLKYVWVAGQVSRVTYAPSGHLYFDLKDEVEDPPAVVTCTMWRPRVMRLRFRVETGTSVLVFGLVTAYPAQGRYQISVEEIEPRGVGALQLRFEQLKEKLAREGIFDPARKRPLPFLPLKVAIVTSPVGAAVQDILRTIRTRCPAVHVLVYPVKVQGAGAAEEIAAAIGHLNLAMPDVDVMIVGRGGGSIEDLWAFNEEAVARAIHASKIPVVSAVGHETDTTIADFAADVRALTPTDGAVRAVPKLDDLLLAMEDLGTKLKRALKTRADLARSGLDALREGRVLGRVRDLPLQLGQRLDELGERLGAGLEKASLSLRERLDALGGSLHAGLPAVRGLARRRVDHLADLLRSHARRAVDGAAARMKEAAAGLEALSPLKVLTRGYSITRLEKTREVLREARQAAPGERILTILGKGILASRVEEEGPGPMNA